MIRKPPIIKHKLSPKITSEECLVLYEKGSKGVIVGVYDSISEYASKEVKFRRKYDSKSYYDRINAILFGKRKSAFCHHLNKTVVPRIRKVSEIIKN